jgi:hypothetical protein
MFDSKYLRAHATHLTAISYSVTDTKSKAALIEVADDLERWADEIDGIDPPKIDGGN